MATLTRAHKQLFARPDDERFASLGDLWTYCHRQKEQSTDRWVPPSAITPIADDAYLRLALGNDGAFALNHWSFSQLCIKCGIATDTINRLSPDTASRALRETMPGGTKPLQLREVLVLGFRVGPNPGGGAPRKPGRATILGSISVASDVTMRSQVA